MEINYVAIVVATIVQFIVGAVWYGPLFGKVWAKIHGFDLLAPEVQKEMMSKMAPMYAVQFGITLVTSAVFGLFVATVPQDWNVFGLAGFYWLGFVAPTYIGAAIWGGTNPAFLMQKIGITLLGSLATLLSMALVFSLV